MEVLGQHEPDALGHTSFDLAAHLCRVDHNPRIGGLHAVEDTDLAGDPVDGDPEAVGVRHDTARRAIRLARLGEPDAASSRRFEEFGQREAPVTAHDSVVIHGAAGNVDARVRCGDREDAVAQRAGRPLHGVAGHEQPRAGEGSGVEAVAIGVRLHKVNACRCGTQLLGRDLHVRGGGALAEFDGADRDLVDAVVPERGPRLRDVFSRGCGLV